MLEHSTRPAPTPSPFTPLLSLLALPVVVTRRLLSHLGLMLTVWVGVTLAVAIVVSVPVYAEAAGYRILLTTLSDSQREEADTLSPFAIIYRYGGASTKPVQWHGYTLTEDAVCAFRMSAVAVVEAIMQADAFGIE